MAIPLTFFLTGQPGGGLGREVVQLVNSHQGPGSYTHIWNGLDAKGNMVSSGVYFYRLRAEGFEQTRKMLFLR